MSATPSIAEVNTQLLEHLVEAAAMKADIANIRDAQHELTTRMLSQMGEIAGDIKAIRADLTAVPEKINACRADMRREVERDFPSRMDSVQMEKRIEEKIAEGDGRLSEQIREIDNKIEKQWVKITTAIVAVSVAAGIFVWLVENVSSGVLK